ncbi:putative acid phosphatase 1, partial [Clarias magur]
ISPFPPLSPLLSFSQFSACISNSREAKPQPQCCAEAAPSTLRAKHCGSFI